MTSSLSAAANNAYANFFDRTNRRQEAFLQCRTMTSYELVMTIVRYVQLTFLLHALYRFFAVGDECWLQARKRRTWRLKEKKNKRSCCYWYSHLSDDCIDIRPGYEKNSVQFTSGKWSLFHNWLTQNGRTLSSVYDRAVYSFMYRL